MLCITLSPILKPIRFLAQALAVCLLASACSPATSTPVVNTGSTSPTTTPTSGPTTTTIPLGRDCVRITGTSSTIDTGEPATDAMFLSGELFVCSDDVVVASGDDLNGLAVGAQLAAALGGPLLLPHPQLAAEIGRLKPLHVHLIGDVEVLIPPETDVTRHDLEGAVELARTTLGVTEVVQLPAVPDASTVIETVDAIAAADRVVTPGSPSTTATTADAVIDPSQVVAGLASPTEAPAVWLVDAAEPATILMAAGSGHVVGAQVLAFDATNILGFPAVGSALEGRPGEQVRFIGTAAATDSWEMRLLLSGKQLPGGGYRILGDDTPNRYVAFYGHPSTAALGVLGEQGPQATLDRMAPFLTDYQADGHRTIPTFEILASVASAVAGDGDYSSETAIDTLLPWIDLAEEQGAYVILDLQPGRDDFLTQAKMYEELLLRPHVGLALDPEWRLKPDQVHLEQVGRVDAAEVNTVVHWLADLVRDNGLPQKMLIVHQFREFMIQDRETLESRPELQMVIQMDGQGPIPTKDTTWAALTAGTEDNHWRWGWKNFFDEDSPTPTPEHTMGKQPVPVFVSYQ